MHVRIACLKQTTWLAIGVICMLGTGSPVRAAPMSVIVEQPPGDSVTPGKRPETVGSPATESIDVEDVKDNATVAKPVQEQFGRDRPLPPPPNSRSQQPLLPSRSQTSDPTGSPQGSTDTNENWTLGREFKEAVRPLYEDLKASGIAEAVRALKSDLGLNSGASLNDPTSSDNAKDLGNAAPTESASAERLGNRSPPQDRSRSATQVEQDKLAAAAALKELIEEVRPWLFGLAGLFVLGYMIKLGLTYYDWTATRSPRHTPRGKRSHRRRRRPQGPIDKSGA